MDGSTGAAEACTPPTGLGDDSPIEASMAAKGSWDCMLAVMDDATAWACWKAEANGLGNYM